MRTLERTLALRGKGFARDAGVPGFRTLALLTVLPTRAIPLPHRAPPLPSPALRPGRIEAPHRRPHGGKDRTMEKTETPQVLNKKQLRTPVPNAVYISRPSIWGNPFAIGREGTRAEVIARYET